MSGNDQTNPPEDYRKLIDTKFDGVEQQIKLKFSGVYSRLDSYNDGQHSKLDKIILKVDYANGKLAEQEKRIQDLEKFQGKCQLPEVKRDVEQLMRETLPNRARNADTNLQKWENIGKIVAAAAIVGSLLYLLIRISNSI